MEMFDEDKAVEFIKEKLAANTQLKKTYSADDILEVIDIVWDYYEDNGLLDIDLAVDSDEPDSKEEEVDTLRLIDHVRRIIKKDSGCSIDPDDVPAIVNAELAYERTLDEL